MIQRTFPLPQGELSLTLDTEVALEEYFSVVARDNPRRAFLFLSKLLGKHLPVSPQTMHNTHQSLAALLAQQTLASPCLFIGMAETATALSQGVYDAWLGLKPNVDSVFVSTTRYYRDGERLAFEEGHSHAPSIGLHIPTDSTLQQRFLSAKTVVVIDDELSTGKTVVSLVNALLEKGLPIEHVIAVCLTDFSQAYDTAFKQALFPIKTARVSLLQGQWAYRASGEAMGSSDLSKAQGSKKITLNDSDDLMARLGVSQTLSLSGNVREQCKSYLGDSKKILILGCGEFMYPPYRLALYLSELGADAKFCATTRSPIKIWGDIKQRLRWDDPYGEGINNFLYNYERQDYDEVWLISELPSNDVLRHTAKSLNARLMTLAKDGLHEDNSIY